MNFINSIMSAFSNLGTFIGSLFTNLINILIYPLAYLLEFLQFIFYFIIKLFEVLISILSIFIALFQFLFAIITGLFRTLGTWLGFIPGNYELNSPYTEKGLDFFTESLVGTGLLSILPSIFIFILWIGFAFKVIQLIGDKGGKTGA